LALLWMVVLLKQHLSYRFVLEDNDEHSGDDPSRIIAHKKAAAAAGRHVPLPDRNMAVTTTTESSSLPFVVAYAVSFIKCGDFQTQSADLTDASLILRHSIHQISSRNPLSGSRYDYKMYAIVHKQAVDCSKALQETGFEVIVVDSPVQQSEIKGEHLRKYIHKEWCCGSDEFIKLYAYSLLPHDIVVHVDIDFAFYKPMDDLFDALRYGPETTLGQAARERIHLERPELGFPVTIDASLTKDWPQVAPNKWPAGYQAGFLVARRDPAVLEEMLEVIREGNYTGGWGAGSGWGELGYGGWVGAMAMQGASLFVSFFFVWFESSIVAILLFVAVEKKQDSWRTFTTRFVPTPLLN
jgi:hypothetical protein